MNLQRAMTKAREKNQAIRRKSWPKALYAYHGMDNLMRSPDGKAIVWSVALLTATDYETTRQAEYHGPYEVYVPPSGNQVPGKE